MSNAKKIAEEIRETFRDESKKYHGPGKSNVGASIDPPTDIGFLIDAVAEVIAKHSGPAPKSD